MLDEDNFVGCLRGGGLAGGVARGSLVAIAEKQGRVLSNEVAPIGDAVSWFRIRWSEDLCWCAASADGRQWSSEVELPWPGGSPTQVALVAECDGLSSLDSFSAHFDEFEALVTGSGRP